MDGKIVSVGVDFLTGTTRTDDRTSSLMHYLIREMWPTSGQLPLVQSWGSHGFHGRGITNAKWGIRGEEGIVQLSGETASKHWMRACELSDQITRIDFQVTIALPISDRLVAERAYDNAIEQGRLKVTMFQNSGGGSTCYLGSRSSRWFGRLYDKGAQQLKDPGFTWRYEVEIKKPAAALEAKELLVAASSEEHILGYVYKWFFDRGVVPYFTPTNSISAIELPKNLTNENKMLQWLSRQVAPCIGKLINSGYRSEVYEALGLPQNGDEIDYTDFTENT